MPEPTTTPTLTATQVVPVQPAKPNTDGKKLIIIGLLVLVFLALLGAIGLLLLNLIGKPAATPQSDNTQTPAPTPAPVAQPTAPELSVKTYTIGDKHIQETTSDGNQINITYPQMQGYPIANAQTGFNFAVESVMQADAQSTRANVVPAAQTSKPKITLNYVLGLKQPDFLSVTVSGVQYNGGATASLLTHVFNYDLANNKQLALGDLFKDSSYLSLFSSYCITNLEAQPYADNTKIESGAGANADNFKLFSIPATADSIVITFPPYSVGPGAAGSPTLTVPLAQFKNLLKPVYASIFTQ